MRHAGLPVTLSLIGQGNVAPYREALERLPDVVLVNRWLSDQEIPGILGTADAVVLPYDEASQSGVVPLAFPLAIPAIVTPVGGLIEQVEHERTGLVAGDLSPESLAACIERLARDAALYERCSAQCLQVARTTLGPVEIGRRFAALIETLHAGPR